ncbi:hypothetical protein C5167_007895 [Papaver somniferum]|nr:hypothetical protein C5167_007895 [Papaver somniferum]
MDCWIRCTMRTVAGFTSGTARTDKIMKREAVSQLLKYRSLKYEENG